MLRYYIILFFMCFFFSVGGCANPTETSGDSCHQQLWPSHNGDIPVCDWLLDTYGCDTFVDYNGDGMSSIEDLEEFCLHEREADTLTQDVNSTPPGGSVPVGWCYTCD